MIFGNGRCFVAPRGADVRKYGSDLRVGELTAPCRHVSAVLFSVDRDRPGASIQNDGDDVGAVGFGDVRIARQRRKRTEALTTCLVARGAFGEIDGFAVGLPVRSIASEIEQRQAGEDADREYDQYGATFQGSALRLCSEYSSAVHKFFVRRVRCCG